MATQIGFPPAAPTLSGDLLTISRFLNDPLYVMRALRTLAEQMFVSNKLLTGQYFTQSGAVLYEQSETIYADRVPQAVAPGGEYPKTTISLGAAQLANTVKWGEDAEVTDEAVNRFKIDAVRRTFIKLANSLVQNIDSVAMSAIYSQINSGNTTAAIASWTGSGSTPNIMRDVALAVQNILAFKQGYQPDAVVLDLPLWAYVISDPTVLVALSREQPGIQQSPVMTGYENSVVKSFRLAGMTWYTSPNVPVTGDALVLDTTLYGAFVDETLPAPGYVASPDDDGWKIQTKTIREDKVDQWLLRARRTTVPIVQEPRAAWLITSAGA